MGLKDVLKKMKLVEAEESATAATPPTGGPRSTPRSTPPRDEMREILANIEPPRLDTGKVAPAAAGQAGGPSFEEVFRAAGIQAPAHGFSAYKVLEIVSSPDLAALDAKSKAQALAAFLRMNPSGPVPIRDVISDAVRRDQALDKFEDFLRQKLNEKAAKAEQESARLQAEIDALLQQKRDAQEKGKLALEEETRRFTEWQARKRIEERKLYDAVAPFIEENPISLGSQAEDS